MHTQVLSNNDYGDVLLLHLQIYLNEELHYPKGYEVSITPSNAATYRSSAKNHIEVTHSASIPQGTVVSVVVTAKQ